MKRAPTTFSLLLGLLVLALTLALGLAAALSIRAGRQVTGETYGRLVAAAAIATDELSGRSDPASQQVLRQLRELGIRPDVAAAPPEAPRRVAPIVEDVGQITGRMLGDPSRVVVTRSPRTPGQRSESQVWVRSSSHPGHWIVLHALNYRREVLGSTLLAALIAGLIALAVAAVAARRLTRPLEGLAAKANALLAGHPIGDTLRGSPREVHHLADAIGAAGKQLRGAARERELMLAGISHDLRTPLARLRLALELGDAGDPQRREAMVDDLQQLDSALEQCLAFVRDGSDEALREIDLVTLVGQLLALRQYPDDWELDGPPLLPVRVRPTLLRRAIGNLMDNAERHGAAPFKVILGSDETSHAIGVGDHGPGVATSLLDRLGQPFLRGDPARSNTIGSGLGLSIVMRAAQSHGGVLELRNAADGGFQATIRLPDRPGVH
ncbi:ATP-binding protein [Rhodanobacter ginsengisoli]|uniref:histidine kinase n=1 Tax=Rhodanobacter ginsengisoli TaxID=418646 RepID=A0ABW0QRI0_9GAMM